MFITIVIIILGTRFARSLVETDTFKKNGIVLNKHLHPVCAEKGNENTDAYWECVIRHMTWTVYHPTSTCRMGPEADKTSVVDAQLRFVLSKFGGKRLFV